MARTRKRPDPTPPDAAPTPGEAAPWDEALALQRAGRAQQALDALAREGAVRPGFTAHAETRRLTARLHADLAHAHEARGDIEGAAAHLVAAAAAAPEFPDVFHRLGVARLRLSDLAGARDAFRRALALAPTYAAPRLELALLDARQGKLGESLALLKRLGETRGAEARADLTRGLERLAEADWEGSEGILRRALGLDGEPTDQRLRDIGAALEAGDEVRALALARAFVHAHPSFPDAHLALALVRRARGEWDDCAESCGRALELHPGFHQARVYLAEALSRRGLWAESDHQLTAVLEDDPEHPLAHALARALHRHPRVVRSARLSH
jgi:tetratricopeptide (TPR) repeat protein